MGTLRRATKRIPLPHSSRSGAPTASGRAGALRGFGTAAQRTAPSGTSRTHTQHQSGAAACVAANALKTRARRPGSTAGAGRKRRRVTAWTETSGGPHAPHARAMVPIDWPLDAGGSPEPLEPSNPWLGKGFGPSVPASAGMTEHARWRWTAHGPHTPRGLDRTRERDRVAASS